MYLLYIEIHDLDMGRQFVLPVKSSSPTIADSSASIRIGKESKLLRGLAKIGIR
jgi:hypothetical protein